MVMDWSDVDRVHWQAKFVDKLLTVFMSSLSNRFGRVVVVAAAARSVAIRRDLVCC